MGGLRVEAVSIRRKTIRTEKSAGAAASPIRLPAPIALALAAIGLTLSGCNSDPTPPHAASPGNGAAPAEQLGNLTTPAPAPEATVGSTGTTGTAIGPTTPAAITACSAEIGATAAAALVRQCRNVSPATHPPCNAANSCAMIRDEIARGCTFLGDHFDSACRADPAGAQAAADVVRRYYGAIDAHDYSTAYASWEDEGRASGKSYAAFAAGFSSTQKTRVAIGAPERIEGAAGSAYVTIPVTVDAMLRDGKQQHFTGSYVLRRSNDVPGASNEDRRWHIHSAALRAG